MAEVRRGVYPRVYGETHRRFAHASDISGLSPRVRGNLHTREGCTTPIGSIPACTGKP